MILVRAAPARNTSSVMADWPEPLPDDGAHSMISDAG